ncbi:hypothetical protein N7449_011352 [Penicillium cf. viridicatum]|uniref:Uncharacterized protein n=1 Tax=Penicillium cf. viridicatum TaxID=2972119 RepID=A0A9W9IYC6_9EURO|nr:hypothetical protein N7449_011352 [Penicillium cf. viridicatum]
MVLTNFFQDLSTHIDWILFFLCFGFVLCFGSFTFVIVHCIVQVVQAAIAFYLFDILYYFIYEEKSTQFFAELISHILSARLELKSFILLLCLLFTIHHSIRRSPPFCAKPMQSPQLPQIDDEMARIHPLKWKKPSTSTSTNPNPPMDSDSTSTELSFPSSSNRHMRHPWGVLDYHIYLSHIESKRDELRRKKECHLLETTGFRQVTLHDEPELDNIPANTNPTVVFVSLPVPDMQDESSTARLVLGFDLKFDRLQGYFFESEAPIENYEDLWQVWNQGGGELVIDVPVERFLAVIRHTMQQQVEILEIGVLHHYGLTTRGFQAGLDMVIAVQFLQFVDDFAELLSEEPCEFRGLYLPFQDELRNLLEGGSRDAWFDVRDGLNIQQYRQKQLKKVVASGLFHGQNMVVLRKGPEQTPRKEKTSRPVKIIPRHSSPWSWSKLQMQVLMSALFILCFCSVFQRERVLCVGMF